MKSLVSRMFFGRDRHSAAPMKLNGIETEWDEGEDKS